MELARLVGYCHVVLFGVITHAMSDSLGEYAQHQSYFPSRATFERSLLKLTESRRLKTQSLPLHVLEDSKTSSAVRTALQQPQLALDGLSPTNPISSTPDMAISVRLLLVIESVACNLLFATLPKYVGTALRTQKPLSVPLNPLSRPWYLTECNQMHALNALLFSDLTALSYASVLCKKYGIEFWPPISSEVDNGFTHPAFFTVDVASLVRTLFPADKSVAVPRVVSPLADALEPKQLLLIAVEYAHSRLARQELSRFRDQLLEASREDPRRQEQAAEDIELLLRSDSVEWDSSGRRDECGRV